MFSLTRSCTPISIDILGHPVFSRDKENIEIYPLKRDTNEWTQFYGAYPMYCAIITNEGEITKRISAGERHVVGVKIDQIDERLMRRDVVRKIGEVLWQLSNFASQGFFWEDHLHWSKRSGSIIIQFDGEDVVFRIFVCDDSGMFHILANVISSVETAENVEKLNKLIYSVRGLFQNKDPFISFESIELTTENWESTYGVTRERIKI